MTRGIAEAAGARDTPSLCVTDFSCQDCVTPSELNATHLSRRCHMSPPQASHLFRHRHDSKRARKCRGRQGMWVGPVLLKTPVMSQSVWEVSASRLNFTLQHMSGFCVAQRSRMSALVEVRWARNFGKDFGTWWSTFVSWLPGHKW